MSSILDNQGKGFKRVKRFLDILNYLTCLMPELSLPHKWDIREQTCKDGHKVRYSLLALPRSLPFPLLQVNYVPLAKNFKVVWGGRNQMDNILWHMKIMKFKFVSIRFCWNIAMLVCLHSQWLLSHCKSKRIEY